MCVCVCVCVCVCDAEQVSFIIQVVSLFHQREPSARAGLVLGPVQLANLLRTRLLFHRLESHVITSPLSRNTSANFKHNNNNRLHVSLSLCLCLSLSSWFLVPDQFFWLSKRKQLVREPAQTALGGKGVNKNNFPILQSKEGAARYSAAGEYRKSFQLMVCTIQLVELILNI